MKRAYSIIEIKAVDDDERIIEGVATTPTPDRVGDIVEPKGAKFSLPLPFLWQHDSEQPVGHVTSAKVTADGIKFKAKFAKIEEPGRLKERLDEAWQSIKVGLVRAVSIGFRSIERTFMDDGGIRFVVWEWLELSAVTIPANQDATITTIRSIDHDLLAASGRAQTDDRREHPGASGIPVVKLAQRSAGKMSKKTIAEQISAFQATRQAKAAQMAEIMDAASEEGETLAQDQQEAYDTLADEVKAIDDHLKRLDVLEKANVASAKPVEKVKNADDAAAARAGVQVRNERTKEPGMEFTRYAMCLMATRGNIPQALELAKHHYPHEDRVHNVLKHQTMHSAQSLELQLKATVAAGTTTDATWAGPLVDYQNLSSAFVEFLRPRTIIGRFGNNGIPSLTRVPFNVRVPTQTSGGAAYWVGQGAPKPLTKFDFDAITLLWSKVANIAVLTEELIRFSDPAAEALVRRGLSEAIIARIDTDFIDPTKAEVANVSPASITNGIPDIVASGTDADAIRYDVRALIATFIAANMSLSSGVWLMSENMAIALSMMMNPLGQPEFPGLTRTGGTFMGMPVITSEYVGDIVVLVNAEDIFLADDGQVVIDASREASLQMLDDPTNNSSTATPTTMVSMFQTNSVALRAERWINWKRARSTAVRWLSGVSWGGALSGS